MKPKYVMKKKYQKSKMIARRKKKKNVKTVEHQFELANKNKVF
jgi:hypothetical protein